ncbi:MAG: SDR family oxidoreductase [Acidimicrobiales bacterium]|nr:SDR family oxidoreductase [Acidimicrobiales bacterium]
MSITFDFTGRTVVVTGAAQGIGLAIGQRFADAGARVVPTDRNAETLGHSWSVSDESTLPIELDVTDPASAAELVERVIDWSGRIDILVNNAGITRDRVVWKLDDDEWNSVIAVHLTGTFNMTRACIPHMRSAGWGRIVNITSFTGLHGNIGQANYAAAKAGIIGFTKTVAKEVAAFGITANAISPNAETAMVAAIPLEKKAELTAQVPMGRFADPSEMTAAVAFLASAEAAYITGAVLPVDGGLAM